MLGVAGTITNFVAFNLLPGGHSDMLNANRFVPVSKRRGFAELGMKTALSALTFANFDPDNNKDVDVEDIVRVLARVKFDADEDDPELYLNAEKAHALAIAILRGEKNEEDVKKAEAFDFIDYMSTQDNGTMAFDEFVRTLALPTGALAPSEEDVAKCKVAWEEGLRTHKGSRTASKKTHKKAKAGRFAGVKVIKAEDVDVTSSRE